MCNKGHGTATPSYGGGGWRLVNKVDSNHAMFAHDKRGKDASDNLENPAHWLVRFTPSPECG